MNEQAQNRFEVIIKQMTEDMKVKGQMAWVGTVNNIRNRAEEIVLREMIYAEVTV